jgi:DNA-binding transcriptional LysR family regulator
MRYFLAIAEERSFTRAAKRCQVPQASLSRQIHSMEVRLETRLFDRLPRHIRLTPAGKIFKDEASKTLEHGRRAVSLVEALKREQDQSLRVGLSVLCDLPRMRNLVEIARRSETQTTVEGVSDYTPELLLSLHRGKLDLAIVDLPCKSRGIGLVPIHLESLIAVLPHNHPLAKRPIVRLFDLKKERFAILTHQNDPGTVRVEAMLRKAGIEPSSIVPAANLIDLLDHVAIERSIGLVRCSAARLRREGIVCKPLTGSIQLETAIAWRTENHSSRMLSFRDALITFGQRSAHAGAS